MIYPEDKVKLIEEIVNEYFDSNNLNSDSVLCMIDTICKYGEKEDSCKQ